MAILYQDKDRLKSKSHFQHSQSIKPQDLKCQSAKMYKHIRYDRNHKIRDNRKMGNIRSLFVFGYSIGFFSYSLKLVFSISNDTQKRNGYTNLKVILKVFKTKMSNTNSLRVTSTDFTDYIPQFGFWTKASQVQGSLMSPTHFSLHTVNKKCNIRSCK